MKRFWDTVTLDREGGEHRILLDGRPMNLPGGGVLKVGPILLAEAIAEEWRTAGGGKGGEMSFADTPLTQLAGTARQRIAANPAPTADAIARYGESDLLCYRAETPAELVARQAASWQPWLDWAADRFGAVLRVTSGITLLRQHHDSIDALRQAVVARDAWQLAGLGVAVPALGSLVLGLALADGCLSAAEAHALGALDELFQAEQWGEDAEAVTRLRNVETEIVLAERFMRLCRVG